MTTRRRSLTGGAAPSPGPEVGLSFPAALLYPPQSQIARYGDAVSARIACLDVHAQKLGEGFGIPFTDFVLNPPQFLKSPDPTLAALAALERLCVQEERVTLDRRGGRWGLYFTRAPSVIGREPRTEALSLRDTALDVRERFLSVSEEFFRRYLEVCEDRLGKMKSAVGAADRTLQLLEAVRID